MRKPTYRLLAAILILTVTFALMPGEARGQQPEGPVTVERETQGDNVREITAPSQTLAVQPAISFIDSASSTCYKPDPTQDTCYINWYYNSVSASPNYMISMTLTINSVGIVARTSGFFQTSMYVPYNMLGDGFRVPCGAPGSGGNPNLGAAYAWTVRARDSAGLSSANYGTTYCPSHGP
jgi:hypothetical protein